MRIRLNQPHGMQRGTVPGKHPRRITLRNVYTRARRASRTTMNQSKHAAPACIRTYVYVYCIYYMRARQVFTFTHDRISGSGSMNSMQLLSHKFHFYVSTIANVTIPTMNIIKAPLNTIFVMTELLSQCALPSPTPLWITPL